MYSITTTACNGCTIEDSVRVYNGVYTFTGPGSDWNNIANWQNGLKPPTAIPAGARVNFNPANGVCIFQGVLNISQHADLRVEPGKKLTILT
ncbi:MAG: hypothetical protein V4722_28770 [Bacteroidota bacterium]